MRNVPHGVLLRRRERPSHQGVGGSARVSFISMRAEIEFPQGDRGCNDRCFNAFNFIADRRFAAWGEMERWKRTEAKVQDANSIKKCLVELKIMRGETHSVKRTKKQRWGFPVSSEGNGKELISFFFLFSCNSDVETSYFLCVFFYKASLYKLMWCFFKLYS